MKIRLCHKIKLTTAIKTFTKYNERSRVASKQTNKQTQQTQRHRKRGNLGRKAKRHTYK